MQLIQIDSNEWNEISSSVLLCVIQCSVQELEEKYDLNFNEYVEDGLGTCFSCYVKINECFYSFLDCFSKESKDIGVSVYIRSFESNPESCLNLLYSAMDISSNDLTDVKDNLSKPSWLVYRVDDNGNEIDMQCFLEEHSALAYAKGFELKKHNQSYFVRNISSNK
ncbi:hypothetical protein [Pleionea sediminis]|uniref:hypothetical protein n=1 Tax=Pleionea sediminis TaxID=2569479 RepID=UPI001184C9BE|nr:hypothetical protein [Pleionea sediminis]